MIPDSTLIYDDHSNAGLLSFSKNAITCGSLFLREKLNGSTSPLTIFIIGRLLFSTLVSSLQHVLKGLANYVRLPVSHGFSFGFWFSIKLVILCAFNTTNLNSLSLLLSFLSKYFRTIFFLSWLPGCM